MDEASDIPTKRRIDGITAIMVVVTVASLLGCGLAPDKAAAEERAAGRGRSCSTVAAARPGDVRTDRPRRPARQGGLGRLLVGRFSIGRIESGGDRSRLEHAQGAGAVCHGGGGRRGRRSRSRPHGGSRERREAAGLSGECRDPPTVWRASGRPAPECAHRRRRAYRDDRPRNQPANDRTDRRPGQAAARRTGAAGGYAVCECGCPHELN